jgi:HAD superfamily hydrolase (TIGR01509 family)
MLDAPRAVLFDLDGVLVDSFDVWFGTVTDVADRFAAPRVTRERMREIWGQGIEKDAENLYPGRRMDEIRAAYDDALPRHAIRMRVNPEATAVLRRLGERGVGRAVVTNTQASLAEEILVAKGLRAGLDHVSALRPGLREKPAPDLLLDALRALGADAHDALMIGDTPFDEAAARGAGVAFLHYDVKEGGSLLAALANRHGRLA